MLSGERSPYYDIALFYYQLDKDKCIELIIDDIRNPNKFRDLSASEIAIVVRYLVGML